MANTPHTTVPGIEPDTAHSLETILQGRLVSMLDLALVLKHIHWNVVGPSFLSVHEMLDQQVAPVRTMADDIAERIATLGGSPDGNAGALVSTREWDDYRFGRETFLVHLRELDHVYAGVIEGHRQAIAAAGELDPVTEGMLIDQARDLEMFQWFVRSFVERAGASEHGTEPNVATRAAERRDATSGHRSDSMPDEREAAMADAVAADVDLDEVDENYREMARIGAAARGEGRIG